MAASHSKREVVLTTNNPDAEILLLDGSFEVVSRGIAPLKVSVAPGLYAMKVKVGDEESESVFTLAPSETEFAKSLDAPKFESPIPLDATSTSRENHVAVVQHFLSASAPTVTVGIGSAVMVCIRDPSKRNVAIASQQIATSKEEESEYKASFMGFSLLDAQGEQIASLDTQGTLEVGGGYMAINVQVNPGCFALAYQRGSETVCFALATAGGWTTQVYINVVSADASSYRLLPDLGGMAIVFERSNRGFDAWRSELVAEETIRKGLIDGRNYLSPTTMETLLRDKLDNPMFGIYAAYLLLDESPPRIDLANTVVENTGKMLGEAFPDITALRWAVVKAQGVTRTAGELEEATTSLKELQGPPVLVRSWDVLLQASKLLAISESSAIPVFKFASDLVGQGGIFLAWSRRAYEIKTTASRISNQDRPTRSSDGLGLPKAMSNLPTMSMLPAMSRGGPLLAALGAVAGPIISAAVIAAKLLRRTVKAGEAPSLAARIAAVQNEEQAAVVLAELARKYPWAKLLPELRKNPGRISSVSGLQRDLMLTLRDAALETEEPVVMDVAFVKRQLETHRVPLSSLVDALSDMELGGWLSSSVSELLSGAVK